MRFILKKHERLFLCVALNLNLMKKNSLTLNKYYIGIVVGVIFLSSCTPTKNVIYFEKIQKDTNVPSLINDNFELKIRKNDLLYIGITSPNNSDNITYNSPQGVTVTTSQLTGINPTTGYQVDENGNIILYKLGTVHVEGLTRQELKLKLEKDLSPYLLNVVVTVRFLNNHVTILGEVLRPQVLSMSTEKLSLLEALGSTGDILFTGRKDNVLVIRETPAGKEFKRLNLTNSSIFNSPYYYLKPDDVVYVEPTEVKIKNSGNTQQVISYVLAGFSIAITIIVNLLR